MKKLLFLSLFFIATHNLLAMEENFDNDIIENNIIKEFNDLNLDGHSIDAILELEDLSTFVKNLKQNKQLETKNKDGWTLLQIAVDEYINIETKIQQINHKLQNTDATRNKNFYLEQNSDCSRCKKSLSTCFTLIKLLLEAGAKIHTHNSKWRTTTYKYVLFNPFCPPQISELFICEKEKRVKNKKLKKEMLKKEQQNK